MRLSLLACGFFLLATAPFAAPPRKAVAATYPADRIGYVTAKQIQAARSEGLPVSELDARQRQKLPKTPGTTRIKFFKIGKGRYGVMLIAPRSVEEYKP